MNKDIENRLKKMIDKKENNMLYLKKIEKNKDTCIEFIEDIINQVKESNIQYLDGYKLRVANAVRTELKEKCEVYEDEDEDVFFKLPEQWENLKIDIILKNENEEFKIGDIDCDIKHFKSSRIVGDLESYHVYINCISILEEYKNKGYGTYILKHIPMIVSYIIRGRIITVSATTNIFKYDKYKIHEYTYEHRIDKLGKWLEKNDYYKSEEIIKENEIELPVYKLKNEEGENLIDIIRFLSEELENLFLSTSYRYIQEKQEKCVELSEKLINEKYDLWNKEEKIQRLKSLKEEFINTYNQKHEEKEKQIELIDYVIKKYNSISPQEMEILESDTFEDIVIKVYCKTFNLRRVSDKLKELGYETEKKDGTKRQYTDPETKYLVRKSNTKYTDLKEYAINILIANKIS